MKHSELTKIMIPKPKKIAKVKKPKPKAISYYRNKADRLLQETVRKLSKRCLICGGELSCGHHFFPKSMSNYLRYNMENIIPICVGCHLRHHSGSPEIHATVLRIKGQDWYDNLEREKNKAIREGFKFNKMHLEYVIETFNKILK